MGEPRGQGSNKYKCECKRLGLWMNWAVAQLWLWSVMAGLDQALSRDVHHVIIVKDLP